MSAAEIETGTMVPLRPCAPWCEDGDGHGSEHPEDRSCWSTYQVVPLSNHEPQQYSGGEWRFAYLNVFLRWLPAVGRWLPNAERPLIYVHSEETDKELRLTLDEARTLLRHLTQLLETADL